MSDLVGRLRAWHTPNETITGDVQLYLDAADRIEALETALKPFAQTGWMTGEIEHTARTIVAHMHPEREREIILSSDDFKRASVALAPEQDK